MTPLLTAAAVLFTVLVSASSYAQSAATPAAPVVHLTEEVVVQAVRADEKTPVTKTDVGREAIELVNRGQEMPFLLAATPAVNVSSDSGIAAGYAYFNIRGVGQTRLNITLDGVPLQDPEDQALYFANFGDFASVVDSIQIQRGVGTSGVGSASYGGSVNFASVGPGDAGRLEAQAGYGSWGTGRGTLALSGPVGGGFGALRPLLGADDGRLPRPLRHRPAGRLLRRDARRGTLVLQALRLRRPRAEPSSRSSRPTRRRSSPTSARTRSRPTRRTTSARTSCRRSTPGSRAPRRRSRPRPTTTAPRAGSGSGTRAHENLQQYAIDGHFVGVVLGPRTAAAGSGLVWGVHANDFGRDHFMDVVGGARAYLNTGLKNELSSFLRASWDQGRARLWADAQLRHARFEYQGGEPLGSVSWTFFNPKAGVRFDATPSLGLYASVGGMSREPARSDMLNGEDDASLPYDLEAVLPESLVDFEAGAEWRRGGLALRADVYAMEFENEIALSGELTEVGLPARRNAGSSHRRGVELGLDYAVSPRLRLGLAAALSRNRIDAWTQHYDVYDADGAWLDSVAVVHRDVPPLLTPEAILNGTLEWKPLDALSLFAQGRYVSAAQLDNTGDPGFRTPAFFNLDLQASLSLRRILAKGEPRIRVQATNLLNDRRLWPSGYSYVYFVRDLGADTLAGTSYYYPQATRSVYATLEVRF